MLELHIHPDQKVIIREDGNILYIDDISNFELDYGASLDPLLENMNERLYIPGVMDRFCDGKTQTTTQDVYVQGDDILDKKDDIIAAKNSRIGA